MLAASVRILSKPAKLSKPIGLSFERRGPGTLNPLFLKYRETVLGYKKTSKKDLPQWTKGSLQDFVERLPYHWQTTGIFTTQRSKTSWLLVKSLHYGSMAMQTWDIVGSMQGGRHFLQGLQLALHSIWVTEMRWQYASTWGRGRSGPISSGGGHCSTAPVVPRKTSLLWRCWHVDASWRCCATGATVWRWTWLDWWHFIWKYDVSEQGCQAWRWSRQCQFAWTTATDWACGHRARCCFAFFSVHRLLAFARSINTLLHAGYCRLINAVVNSSILVRRWTKRGRAIGGARCCFARAGFWCHAATWVESWWRSLRTCFRAQQPHEGTQLSLRPKRATTWTWWTPTTRQHCRPSWDWTFVCLVFMACLKTPYLLTRSAWARVLCALAREGRCCQCNLVEEKQTCGKGITWLQPYREALFSPASSNIATRILPISFLLWGNIKRPWCLQLMWRTPPWQLSKSNPHGLGAPMQVEPRFATSVLAEFYQVNVMVAFSGTKIWWSFSKAAAWKWPRMRPTRPYCAQPKVIVWC